MIAETKGIDIDFKMEVDDLESLNRGGAELLNILGLPAVLQNIVKIANDASTLETSKTVRHLLKATPQAHFSVEQRSEVLAVYDDVNNEVNFAVGGFVFETYRILYFAQPISGIPNVIEYDVWECPNKRKAVYFLISCLERRNEGLKIAQPIGSLFEKVMYDMFAPHLGL